MPDSADSARRRTRASETPAGLAAALVPPPSFSPDHHASSGGSVSARMSTETPRLQRRSSAPETPKRRVPPLVVTSSFFFILAAPSALAEPFPVREEREESSPRGRRGREPPAVRRAPRSGRESFLPREFRRGSVGVVGGDDPRRRQLRQRVLADSRPSRRRATSESPRARLLRRVRANDRLRVRGGEFEVRPERFAFRGGERFASRGVGETSSSARVAAAAGVSEAACTAERMREAAAAARGASRRRRHSRRVARRGSTTAADAEGVAPLPRETDGTPPKIEDAGADDERGRGGARGGSWG